MQNSQTTARFNTSFCLYAPWIIPIVNQTQGIDNHKVLKDTAIIIESQLIKDILPISAAKVKYPGLPAKILNNQVIMPGFVNTHTHCPMNLLKGYADDLPLMTWLNDHIWPVEQQFLSEEFAYDGTILAIAEMLKNGITCFNDMYFYSNSIAKAAQDLGIRANIGTHAFDYSSKWAVNMDEYLQHALTILEEYQNYDLINSVICPHAPYTVNDENFIKIRKFAEKYHMPVGCHVHETNDEIQTSLQQYGIRPLARLHKLGILDLNFHAIHMTQLLPEEIKLLAKKNISVVHCPKSNLKLASGFSPIKEMLQHQINIGIGTDGAASNNELDMLSEMRFASLVAKTTALDPTILPDYQALELATINGAKLMGLDQKIGSLTIGKEADIIALDLSDIGSNPVYNPISSIVYTASKRQISNVWVKGIQKVADHKLIAIDDTKIQEIINKWSTRILTFKKNKQDVQ
jgi:5-methylthioadenosine/S-adenosylhomocysteine deaminase